MLVATHKSADVPADDFHLPVHVGHALNPVDLGYQPDDTGPNISAANPSYCELTAVYWAWHNTDSDAIGLSHYRRYFRGSQPGPHGTSILSRAEAGRLLADADVVLAKPRNYVITTIDGHYRLGHHGADLDVLRSVLASYAPEALPAYERVFGGRRLSQFNMFLMRRATFEAYAGWLFPLLEEVDRRLDGSVERTAYQQRTIGFLAERLLSVWAYSDPRRRVATHPIVNTEGEPRVRKGAELVGRRLGLAQRR